MKIEHVLRILWTIYKTLTKTPVFLLYFDACAIGPPSCRTTADRRDLSCPIPAYISQDTSSHFSAMVSRSSPEHGNGAKRYRKRIPIIHAILGTRTLDIILRYVLAPSLCSSELHETITEKWEEVSLQLMYAGIGQLRSRLSGWSDMKVVRLRTRRNKVRKQVFL
jgi:hypothetical protein